MQDELADLMSRNMHIGMQPPTHDVSNPPTPQVVPQQVPITYISQHYHHSAHVVPVTAPTEEMQVSSVLQNAGVNTDALLPSQLQLFKDAQQDQRERLIELWRIAPPTFGTQLASSQMGDWPQTSMDLEEEAARHRWETQEQEKFKNLSVLPRQEIAQNAEPYMQQGYDADMMADDKVEEYRSATDPVHNREREWWHMAEQPIEHQYGMLQQWGLYDYCGPRVSDTMML